MPVTPGKPHTPTIHPRTRPEAEQYAMKNRQTSDWFRHDGKNVEAAAPPPHRTGASKAAGEIKAKAGGNADQWFQHGATSPSEPQPAVRCPTAESKAIHDKVHGKEEAWYKMEENQDYYSQRAGPSVKGEVAEEAKQKSKGDSMGWFKHEHGKTDEFTPTPPKHRTGPMPHVDENGDKMRPHGAPQWYSHGGKNGTDSEDSRPHSRVATSEAGEYLERNKAGSVSDWYTHDHKANEQNPSSPRVTSSEAQQIAHRLKGESDNWFNHDGSKQVSVSKTGKGGRDGKATGDQVAMCMSQPKSTGEVSKAPSRVKPEAGENARKSTQGMMDKYLNQDQNKDYQSARQASRVVKPEAQMNFEKNQGSMDSVMQGYLPSPTKHNPRRIKSEAEVNAERNKGSVGQVMGGQADSSQSPRKPGRGNKPEAEEYATRNRGTLDQVMHNVADMRVSGRPGQRLNSADAEQYAQRNRGTVGDLMHMNT